VKENATILGSFEEELAKNEELEKELKSLKSKTGILTFMLSDLAPLESK
jgi:hypothetical protein